MTTKKVDNDEMDPGGELKGDLVECESPECLNPFLLPSTIVWRDGWSFHEQCWEDLPDKTGYCGASCRVGQGCTQEC